MKTENPITVLWKACARQFSVVYGPGDFRPINPKDAVALYVQGVPFGDNAKVYIKPLLSVNDRLAVLAREYDSGKYQGPGEYLAETTKIVSRPIWGGDLLGWTTQAEVDALEESISRDY